MFSYRHAYHAGNHADVLKHFVQVQLHEYMNQKDTPYTYIDTHAGAGVYALDSAQALKSGEFVDGIGRLWERDDLPPALADYVKLVRELNPSGKLRYYPGSPWVADTVSRAEDRLRLFELHPADSRLLAANVRKLEEHKAEQGERARGRRILIDVADGFHGLKALLPPPSRRALVLVDPPYEVKLDYKHVRDALEDSLGRFPSGIYAVWYPALQRIESRQFADRLKRLPNGLAGSAMFILNPPFTLEATLREVLPYLVQVLGQDSGASFRIERGTQLSGAQTRGTGERSAPAGTPAGTGRTPIGNARRASPLSGKGSLRLPGQPFGDPQARGAAPEAPSKESPPAKRQVPRSVYGQNKPAPAAGPARGKSAAADGAPRPAKRPPPRRP
jgi:23S rRNA (adenine2030-N6)-methyltransferase